MQAVGLPTHHDTESKSSMQVQAEHGEEITETALREMVYTEACVKEALRIRCDQQEGRRVQDVPREMAVQRHARKKGTMRQPILLIQEELLQVRSETWLLIAGMKGQLCNIMQPAYRTNCQAQARTKSAKPFLLRASQLIICASCSEHDST